MVEVWFISMVSGVELIGGFCVVFMVFGRVRFKGRGCFLGIWGENDYVGWGSD